MGNESKKNNKKIVIPILVIGVILVLAGLGFNYLTSSKYVAKEAIKGLSNNMIKLLDSQKNITGLEENFTTTSNIKVNLQSDYFSSLATVSPTYQAISNLLKNISQIETQITYVQDKKNKRMFVSYDSKMASQPFVNLLLGPEVLYLKFETFFQKTFYHKGQQLDYHNTPPRSVHQLL